MPQNQTKSNARRQSLERKSLANQGKRPRGIERKQLLRPVRKSARLHPLELKDTSPEQTHPLPSPSASNIPSEESPQELSASLKSLNPDRKRKRSQEAEDLLPRIREGPTPKEPRILLASCAVKGKEAASGTGNKNGHPINYWVQKGSWPKEYFEPDPNMSQLSRKRSFSAMSYTQSVKEGENPPAYTPEYEEVLAKAGIFMYQNLGQATISDTCKKLCATLLNGEYETPEHSLFKDDIFWIALERVRSKNEWRVVRDITSSLIPSAELLYIYGASNLQHLIEEINAEWTKCICLAGPRPKPDFAVGLMSSAFTDSEVEKLKSYTAPGKATLYTGKLYFPFLMCEVKCGENGLNIADRQNAHSASIAVNAIVQLYRDQAVSRAMELHRKILVFSVSHDHTMVKIWGHYPLIEGNKTTFYRHLIRSFDFTEQDGKEKWTAYKFIRKVYDTFVPIHLERLRSAITQLPAPQFKSITSTTSEENESEIPNSQEIATSAPSSQDTTGFKKPRLPLKFILQQENDRLKEQNMNLLDRQRQEMKQENDGLKELLDRQRQEMKQENDGLKELLDRQRQEMKQENDGLKAQIKDLMNMLKQRLA